MDESFLSVSATSFFDLGVPPAFCHRLFQVETDAVATPTRLVARVLSFLPRPRW